MDRQEWMYRISRVDPSYLDHVRKFVAAAKKHRLSLKRTHITCLCNRCWNKLAQKDDVVLSHLIRYGFVKDYTVWKFQGEADVSVGTSGGNSAADGGHGTAADDNADREPENALLFGAQGSGGLLRCPFDNIVKRIPCTLMMPYGRTMPKKKEVARGVALPPERGSMYDNRPIPPDYTRVDRDMEQLKI